MAQDKDKKRTFLVPIWREALVAMSLGWDLAVPIFGGVMLGYYLDRKLGTNSQFTMGLFLLGVAIGYYNLIRFIRKTDRYRNKREKKEDENQ